ncbi:hypothetical protein [Legionella impletisoli]|uniref:Uncharacterized protein n=2 Tax=Bacteria TaxID=2 RepID=A0A917JQT2_9GAMM|nr:hypothetical protein [Legionella impletisoli]GGI82273.1 hypothetical protein GCM10007966_08520 [Legionella impletisoli]
MAYGETAFDLQNYSLEQALIIKSNCPIETPPCEVDLNTISEEKLLAGIAYGEASTLNNFAEMAAIASATVRRRNAAHQLTVNALVQKYRNFSYAVYDGNARYNRLMCSASQVPFAQAYEAARNALYNGMDYAFGGCFWDGYDLKTKGVNHIKYKQGFRFIHPIHNLFCIPESPFIERIIGGKIYHYMFDSTAAHGGTILWKLNKEYLKAAGAGQCL